MGLDGVVPAGVVTGKNLIKLIEYCRDNGHALPAFNCTSTSTINAILEVSSKLQSVIGSTSVGKYVLLHESNVAPSSIPFECTS